MKLQEDDKKLLKKADALLKDIEQNPYDRIEKDGEKYIEIAQCGTRYHK